MTGDGQFIRRHIWQGKKDICHENIGHSFFKQPRPGETAWSTWRTILKTAYGCNDCGKFPQSKGEIQISEDWKWFLDDENDRVNKRLTRGWE
jgi:hypothetical protein